MDAYGFVDYKRPVGKQNDMRTSTYRGHVHVTDTMLGNEFNAKFDASRPYTEDPELGNMRTSNYNANYTWKFDDPDYIRNPTLKPKMDLIKSFEECKLRFVQRPIRPPCSVSHEDYLWQPAAKAPKKVIKPMPRPVEVSKIMIDRAKPGYAKHLDTNATTSRLAFVAYTPKELMGGVAAKDNITFWNWNRIQTAPQRVFRERDEQLCAKLPAKQCPKRRCEFQCTVKHVPHTGLTTEVRENYLEPVKRALEYNISHIRNRMVHYPAFPTDDNTESKIIGSGERTQKYV